MNELVYLASFAFFVGVLSGIGFALIICRFIPQRVDCVIGFVPVRPPGMPPEEQDPSEAWKGGEK